VLSRLFPGSTAVISYITKYNIRGITGGNLLWDNSQNKNYGDSLGSGLDINKAISTCIENEPRYTASSEGIGITFSKR
jgi:hypothetical protein